MQKNRLFVGNLSYDWPTTELEQALHEIFSVYGKIESIHVPKHVDSGRHKGIAFVTYEKEEGGEESAAAAKEALDGKPDGPDGEDAPTARPLHIDFAKSREDRGDRPKKRW